jgi:hypothetical protein
MDHRYEATSDGYALEREPVDPEETNDDRRRGRQPGDTIPWHQLPARRRSVSE